MAVWKQLLLCVGLLAVAAALWIPLRAGRRSGVGELGLRTGPSPRFPKISRQKVHPVPVDPAARATARDTLGDHRAIRSRATINDRLTAIGTGRALFSVSVDAVRLGEADGSDWSEPGARVAAGTPIATLDSEAEQIALRPGAHWRAEDARRTPRQRFRGAAHIQHGHRRPGSTRRSCRRQCGTGSAQCRTRRWRVARSSRRFPDVVGILPVSARGNYVTRSNPRNRHHRRPFADHHRLLGAGALRHNDIGRCDRVSPLASRARAKRAVFGRVSAIDKPRVDEGQPLYPSCPGHHRQTEGDLLSGRMSFQVSMRVPRPTCTPSVESLAIQWGHRWRLHLGGRRCARASRAGDLIQRNTDSVS